MDISARRTRASSTSGAARRGFSAQDCGPSTQAAREASFDISMCVAPVAFESRLIAANQLQDAKVRTLMKSIENLKQDNTRLKKCGQEHRQTEVFKQLQVELGRQDGMIAVLRRRVGEYQFRLIQRKVCDQLSQIRAAPDRCLSCSRVGEQLFSTTEGGVYCKACYVRRCWVQPPVSSRVSAGGMRPKMKDEIFADIGATKRAIVEVRKEMCPKRERHQQSSGDKVALSLNPTHNPQEEDKLKPTTPTKASNASAVDEDSQRDGESSAYSGNFDDVNSTDSAPRGPGNETDASRSDSISDTNAGKTPALPKIRGEPGWGPAPHVSVASCVIGPAAELASLLAQHDQRAQHLTKENASLAEQRKELEKALDEQAQFLKEYAENEIENDVAVTSTGYPSNDALERRLRLKGAESNRIKDATKYLEIQLESKKLAAGPVKAECDRLFSQLGDFRANEIAEGSQDSVSRTGKLEEERVKGVDLEKELIHKRLQLRVARQNVVGETKESENQKKMIKRDAAKQRRESLTRIREKFEVSRRQSHDVPLQELYESYEVAGADLEYAQSVEAEEHSMFKQIEARAVKSRLEADQAKGCQFQENYQHERSLEKLRGERFERLQNTVQLRTELPKVRGKIQAEEQELARLRGAVNALDTQFESAAANPPAGEVSEQAETLFNQARLGQHLRSEFRRAESDSVTAVAAAQTELEMWVQLRKKCEVVLCERPQTIAFEPDSHLGSRACSPQRRKAKGGNAPAPGLLPLPPRLLVARPGGGVPDDDSRQAAEEFCCFPGSLDYPMLTVQFAENQCHPSSEVSKPVAIEGGVVRHAPAREPGCGLEAIHAGSAEVAPQVAELEPRPKVIVEQPIPQRTPRRSTTAVLEHTAESSMDLALKFPSFPVFLPTFDAEEASAESVDQVSVDGECQPNVADIRLQLVKLPKKSATIDSTLVLGPLMLPASEGDEDNGLAAVVTEARHELEQLRAESQRRQIDDLPGVSHNVEDLQGLALQLDTDVRSLQHQLAAAKVLLRRSGSRSAPPSRSKSGAAPKSTGYCPQCNHCRAVRKIL